MVRHRDEIAANRRRKLGEPALRTFRVVRLIPEASAIEVDTQKTGMRPVISLRHAIKVPASWWMFDDGSGASGQGDVFTTPADARGDTRRQFDEVLDSSLRISKVYEVETIEKAVRRRGRWWYRIKFLNYEDSEMVDGEALRDAGSWVQVQMRRAREEAERQDAPAPSPVVPALPPPPGPPVGVRRSPRLAGHATYSMLEWRQAKRQLKLDPFRLWLATDDLSRLQSDLLRDEGHRYED